MTRRQRRSVVNEIRRIKNAYGDETALKMYRRIIGGISYWDYKKNRLVGLLLTDTRGRGVVVDL